MNEKTGLVNLVNDSPVYLSALGVAPLVMMSKSMITGFFIGSCFAMVLVFTSMVLSLIRPLVSYNSRLAYILVLTATGVTLIDLITRAVLYDLNLAVDLYLPLIAMNSLVLFYMESVALKNQSRVVFKTVFIICGLIFVICLSSGAIREVLAQGSIFHDLQRFSPYPHRGLILLPDILKLPIAATSAGAFMVTGFVFSLINMFLKRIQNSGN